MQPKKIFLGNLSESKQKGTNGNQIVPLDQNRSISWVSSD